MHGRISMAGNVGEEAFGERAKGAAKDALGAVTGNESLERDGERQNYDSASGGRIVTGSGGAS
jgi:uncharacterized protein YjbJ (UPF0337 family)